MPADFGPIVMMTREDLFGRAVNNDYLTSRRLQNRKIIAQFFGLGRAETISANGQQICAAFHIQCLGSARASRAGDGALAIANFNVVSEPFRCDIQSGFGGAPQPAREGACAPRSLLPRHVIVVKKQNRN